MSRACTKLVVASALASVLGFVACKEARPASSASGGGGGDPTESTSKAATPTSASATAPAPAPATEGTSALPPPTTRKPGCLDSTRGAKHTFVGKLEKHPDGSGNLRVVLPKKVCFGGGRFSAGETNEVILDVEEWKAKPLLAKKVKVVGTSQDYAPGARFAYVMHLEVTSLAASK